MPSYASENADYIVCDKCKEKFVLVKTTLNYLGHQFTADLPQCPKCGMVYISEELVNGKIAQVEMDLEDK